VACDAPAKRRLWVKDTTGSATQGNDCFLKSTFSAAPCTADLAARSAPCRRKLAGRASMVPAGPAPPPAPAPPPPPPIPPQVCTL
jgi:hypothetical protein